MPPRRLTSGVLMFDTSCAPERADRGCKRCAGLSTPDDGEIGGGAGRGDVEPAVTVDVGDDQGGCTASAEIGDGRERPITGAEQHLHAGRALLLPTGGEIDFSVAVEIAGG